MPDISGEALYNACSTGDAAAVSRLLPAGGTQLNLSGPRFQEPTTKSTPLMMAAWRGHTEIARMLLARAPNTAVDFADARGATALLAAAIFHNADIIRLLADCGANVNFTKKREDIPLCRAVSPMKCLGDGRPRDPDPDGARQIATVKALLRLGAGTPPHAPPPATVFIVYSPFPQKSVSTMCSRAVHTCLTARLPVRVPSVAASDPVDEKGVTPLIVASGLGLAEVAFALLDGGANMELTTPSLRSVESFTPLMLATMQNHTGIVQLLLERGADGTKVGRSGMMTAC
jgi:ankyrin repeat protein